MSEDRYVVWLEEIDQDGDDYEHLLDAVEAAEGRQALHAGRGVFISRCERTRRGWHPVDDPMSPAQAREMWARRQALVWEPYPSVQADLRSAGLPVFRARYLGGWLVRVDGAGITWVPYPNMRP